MSEINVERLERMRREFNEQIDIMIEQARRPIVLDGDVELLGQSEVADVTGLPISTLRNLRSRGKMPKPIAELAAGPVWLKPDIVQWAKRRKRDERAELRRRAAR